MDNNNKKGLIKQPKQSRRELIETAKKQWGEDANLLTQEKADIGLNDLIVAEVFQRVIEKNREHGDEACDREHRAAGKEKREL